MPQRSHNPLVDKAGKIILDQEEAAKLKKKAIGVVSSSEDEDVSEYFARPKRVVESSRRLCPSSTPKPGG